MDTHLTVLHKSHQPLINSFLNPITANSLLYILRAATSATQNIPVPFICQLYSFIKKTYFTIFHMELENLQKDF